MANDVMSVDPSVFVELLSKIRLYGAHLTIEPFDDSKELKGVRIVLLLPGGEMNRGKVRSEIAEGTYLKLEYFYPSGPTSPYSYMDFSPKIAAQEAYELITQKIEEWRKSRS